MADGYDIHLDGERAERLAKAAEAAGVAPADLALIVLDEALASGWAEAFAAFAEYDRTGESYPAREVLDEFAKNVEAELVARGK